jgi:RNA polymerase sigma-70 factor, ECF subfamily
MREADGRMLPDGRLISVSKGTEGSPDLDQPIDWKVVVEQIRAGDPAGQEALYRNLAAGARLFLRRRLGTHDVEDRVHDLFLIVVETIRRGELREPERLMGFIRTVLYRQLSLEFSRIARVRHTSVGLESAANMTSAEPTPEQQAARQEKIELMQKVLKTMSEREFEVLTRFYLHEQPSEQICKEMRLTQTQFDLLKSRAKARLTESARRRLARSPLN